MVNQIILNSLSVRSGRNYFKIEGHRLICINYDYKGHNGWLKYAASVYTDPHEEKLAHKEIKPSIAEELAHTAQERFEKCPVVVTVDSLLEETDLVYVIRRLMCRGPGCSGSRTTPNEHLGRMKDHRMRDGYQKDFTVLETDNYENVDDGVIISGYLFTRYGDDELFYIRYNLDVVSGDLEYGLAMRAVPRYFEITSKITELDKSLFWVAGQRLSKSPAKISITPFSLKEFMSFQVATMFPYKTMKEHPISLLSEIVKHYIINKPVTNQLTLFNKLQ